MLKQMKRWASATQAHAMLNDDSGAALVEYGMLVGLIAVVCIVAVGVLGNNVNDVFCYINGQLAANLPAVPGIAGC